MNTEDPAAYLKAVDPTLAPYIDQVGPFEIALRVPEPFEALIRSIMYQQLAGPAAAAILRKFLANWGDRYPSPEEVLALTDEQFRASGVSRQKMGYLRDLAEKSVAGELHGIDWDGLDDEEIIRRLTAVKGIGRWSAEMFLMFSLGRLDVLPVDDLGVRKGFQKVYDLPTLPKADEMREIAEKWRPYRSAGSWYMWRILATVTIDQGS